MADFPLLFSPLKVGSFTIRNRIMSTPHHTVFTDPDGLPGPREIAYWVGKAKGGIGLIGSHVHGIHYSTGNTFAQPAAVAKFRAATEAIHEHGAKFVCQLWHPGAQGGMLAGGSPWAPSPVSQPDTWAVPHEMTTAETREVIAGYGRGAAILREAGVDGAEIHGAHGYLITQFLSPLSNQRDDEYGGDFERRLNFPLQIIEAIRSEVGKDWTVGMRISGDEMTEYGYTSEDFAKMIPYLTAGGQLDYLSVSVGNYRSKDTIIAPMYYPGGSFVYLAAMAKEVLDIPVVCIGRINDPVMAEQVLENRQADIVGMTRANICDPELPNKAREGRLDEIRHCLGCNEGCWGHIEKMQAITCSINPAIGRELHWGDFRRTSNPRKLVVVGGGPAGCEAARVAALSGHSVTLFEAEPQLGGQTVIAARGPGRTDFAEVGRYFSVELKRLGVDVRLGARATAADVLALNPDDIFVATGGRPLVPDHIEGVDSPNVVQAWDVLNGVASVGQDVVILDDEHHIQGLNVAELLASQGKQVEVCTRELEVGKHAEPITRTSTLRRVHTLGVKLSATTWARSITPTSITLYNFYSSMEQTRPVDTVVLCCNILPDNALYRELAEKHPAVRAIGDCTGPHRLEAATFDGHLAARSLDAPQDLGALINIPGRRG
ncbi:MAG: FAD-dependent oxidoreductase [Dehalococcoidia bacterium]|nr:FAD-dependent oxidoreductase [Dehalococcoidia bacterium]